MKKSNFLTRLASGWKRAIAVVLFCALSGGSGYLTGVAAADESPTPLLEKGHPVDWWFVFKFNAASFPRCAPGAKDKRECLFGGDVQSRYKDKFSQQFVYASSEQPTLQLGSGCVGDTATDPLGATFEQVYNGPYFYVIWNDQFYQDPKISGCGKACSAPWAHSKGMLAWNESGEGFAMQVTTPSWPAAGNSQFPRETDGNTLGCVTDNDVLVSQHFFSVRLNKDDLLATLDALQNASVVTDPTNQQIVRNGGPSDVQALVSALGVQSDSQVVKKVTLSTGVGLISKPSDLNVPPWQLVSAELGGIPLRAATWWQSGRIYSTTASTKITCWDASLSKPGPVGIATSGQWKGQFFALTGGPTPNSNHAKIGVSTSSGDHFSIFGDMNQEGSVRTNCADRQNGRGGLFYVLDDPNLFTSVSGLIKGGTAPNKPPTPQ